MNLSRSRNVFVSILRVYLCTVTMTAISFAPSLAIAQSFWTGGDNNWDSVNEPGWTTGGIPTGVGAVANFNSNTAGTTTQNITGLTVGTISYSGGNANVARTITLANPITLNNDGAGSGFVTVANTNTSATTSANLKMGQPGAFA